MPHAVLDDSDDDEGGEPFDELHDLGDGDDEEVEDEDIATLEQAPQQMAARFSRGSSQTINMMSPRP